MRRHVTKGPSHRRCKSGESNSRGGERDGGEGSHRATLVTHEALEGLEHRRDLFLHVLPGHPPCGEQTEGTLQQRSRWEMMVAYDRGQC